MLLLKQSEATAALRRWFFVCVQDADGKTPMTSQTFTGAEIQLSKAGGAFASFAGTYTELASGMYYYEATATELNTLGIIGFKVNKSGVRLVNMQPAQVVGYDPNVDTGQAIYTAVTNLVYHGAPVMGENTFKQSEATAARRRVYFTMTNGTTGARLNGQTSTNIQPFVSVNGGTPAAGTGTCVEVANALSLGQYYYEFTAAELATLGVVTLSIGRTGTGNPAWKEIHCKVVAYDPFDVVRQGMTALPNVAFGTTGGLLGYGSGTGQVLTTVAGKADANQTHYAGTAVIGTMAAVYGEAGTAQAGGATTITLAAGASAVDNTYAGRAIHIYSATGIQQTRICVSYVGSTKVATVDRAWATNPAASSLYYIPPGGNVLPATIVAATGVSLDAAATAAAVWNAARATYATAASFGEGVSLFDGSITAAKLATGAITAAKFAASAITDTVLDATAAAKVRDSILDATLRTGRTVRGLFRRQYALLFGKATGLIGNTTIAYQPDGTTPEITVTRNAAAGTRVDPGAETA